MNKRKKKKKMPTSNNKEQGGWRGEIGIPNATFWFPSSGNHKD
jgi:hypothetical protein